MIDEWLSLATSQEAESGQLFSAEGALSKASPTHEQGGLWLWPLPVPRRARELLDMK
ncbi:MAG TPA: hypothetical protein PK095_00620 [Myxococcota bacterium]|nr:hypothetical protein [Myxococcota bacterium]